MGIDDRLRLGIGVFIDSSELRRVTPFDGATHRQAERIHLDRTRTGAYARA